MRLQIRDGWLLMAALAACLTTLPGIAPAQDVVAGEPHRHTGPVKNFLSEESRDMIGRLMVQDYQGRMKPLDTLARESIMKISKKSHFDGWEPIDMFFSMMIHHDYWNDQALLAVRYPGLKDFLGVSEATKHVTPASLYDGVGNYRLSRDIDVAHRTPDKEKSKTQKKLLSFDERFNLFMMTGYGLTLRIFPVPGHENNTWLSAEDIVKEAPAAGREYQEVLGTFLHALQDRSEPAIHESVGKIAAIQKELGQDVLPSGAALWAELQLNKLKPFTWASLPYLAAFPLLIAAYAWSLIRHRGGPLSLKNPLYALGLLVFLSGMILHLYGYVLRWISSGRAPLSNGYESLVFIALMIAVAGLLFEMGGKRGSIAGLSSLLASVILGVSMLPTFDPAITPLVPVLASFWLIVHVTIITASYGFLGLAAVMAMTILFLHFFKGRKRRTLQLAIYELDRLHWHVLVTGLAFLSIGTFLGGVWANESWGRYWGWDPKESWSLVTILIYAVVAHFRWIEKLRDPIHMAAGSFLAIWTVGMTYFGVNYFLSGLHSYAQGDSPGVPTWVFVMAISMVLITFGSYQVNRAKRW